MNILTVCLSHKRSTKLSKLTEKRSPVATYVPKPLVSAEASRSGLRKHTHSCLTPSEINLAAIKNKRAAVLL